MTGTCGSCLERDVALAPCASCPERICEHCTFPGGRCRRCHRAAEALLRLREPPMSEADALTAIRDLTQTMRRSFERTLAMNIHQLELLAELLAVVEALLPSAPPDQAARARVAMALVQARVTLDRHVMGAIESELQVAVAQVEAVRETKQ